MTVAIMSLHLFAESTPSTRPSIALSSATEEGKKTLIATVTMGGKPLSDASVVFSARRTFGALSLGEDKTLDDGTAAVPFPEDLPGGVTGALQIIAEVKPSEKFGSARIEGSFLGGKIVPEVDASLPRALWARRAPLALVIPIVALISGVWLTYAYVIFQIVKLRKEAVHDLAA
jgi:hypothetical protein